MTRDALEERKELCRDEARLRALDEVKAEGLEGEEAEERFEELYSEIYETLLAEDAA